jgi:hypothetical protein
MAQFAPIDYGPQVSPVTTGVREMEQAVEEHGQKRLGAERNLGEQLKDTSLTVLQNKLHRETTEASTKAAEGTELALKTIEDNPYVMTRDAVAQAAPEAADQLWEQARASGEVKTDDQGHETIPTHVIGRQLYMTMAKKSREEAAKGISLPGWRGEFLKTAEAETLAKQERWIDPKLAAQRTAYDRAVTLTSADKAANLASTPEDFELPIRQVETSPSLSPPEKAAKIANYRARQDTVIIDRAMKNPVANEAILKSELLKLQSPNAKTSYPNHDEKERADLVRHVETGLHVAQMARDSQIKAQDEANKRGDDAVVLSMVKSLATGQVAPESLLTPHGAADMGQEALWSQLKTRDGAENFYHIIEAFKKNQEADKDKDAPGAYSNLMNLYIKDPDKFRAELFSGETVKGLSPASMKHFMEKAAGLADKDRSEADRKEEEHTERRLFVAMTNPEGGAVNASDYSNPQERTQYAEMEQFVRDTLANEERSALAKNKHMTPDQKMTVMLNAAKEYRGSSDTNMFGTNKPLKGIVAELANGDTRKINLPERTAMQEARRKAGGTGVISFSGDGADYYNNYNAAIEAGWKDILPGEKPSMADSYRVYYEAKKLASGDSPVTDPAMQVATVLMKLARSNAAKNKGGTK